MKAASLIAILAFASAQAAVRVQPVEYKGAGPQDTATLAGLLAADAAGKAKKPGIVLFPDWMGVSDTYRAKAEKLAALGYVVLVADVYGKGNNPKDQGQAGAVAAKYKGDRPLTRARAAAALEQLRKTQGVDTSRLAAMGYCFGGMVALELARSGASLDGTVSFHGNLDTPDPADAKNIKGSVLVLHGAEDPYVPEGQIKNFRDEMKAAGVDWEMIYYSGAVHSFTNPAAGADPAKGNAYHPKADARSWEAMKDFYQEVLAAAPKR